MREIGGEKDRAIDTYIDKETVRERKREREREEGERKRKYECERERKRKRVKKKEKVRCHLPSHIKKKSLK